MKRLLFVVALTSMFGCSEAKKVEEEAFSPVEMGPQKIEVDDSAPSEDKNSGVAASAHQGDQGLLNTLRTAPLKGAQLMSQRTLSSKIWLGGGIQALFKPFLRENVRSGYEVAVFRIGEGLGVGRIPPSTVRDIPLSALLGYIEKKSPDEARKLARRADVDEERIVRGAVIEWVKGLNPRGWEEVGGRRFMAQQLAPARPKGSESPLAAELSAMVVFDYLVGNWDRFSGGNIFLHPEGGVLLLDHNGTIAPWSDRQREKMEALLTATERFPDGLIERLRKLDEKEIEGFLRREPSHRVVPLLTRDDISLMLSRRDRILAHVYNLIQGKGAAAVLPFD